MIAEYTCTKCGTPKLESGYYFHPDGYRNGHCKTCHNIRRNYTFTGGGGVSYRDVLTPEQQEHMGEFLGKLTTAAMMAYREGVAPDVLSFIEEYRKVGTEWGA